MMDRTAYPWLRHLFGAYFHQDWDTEGEDWPDLVRNYGAVHPPDELRATAEEVEQLLADIARDSDLEHQLFAEFGCGYTPRPDLGGPTVRDWLGQVASLLRHLDKG